MPGRRALLRSGLKVYCVPYVAEEQNGSNSLSCNEWIQPLSFCSQKVYTSPPRKGDGVYMKRRKDPRWKLPFSPSSPANLPNSSFSPSKMVHIASALAVGLLGLAGAVSAHPGHDHRAETAERRAFLGKAGVHQRSLSKCATTLKARGHENANVMRRSNLVKSIRQRRGLKQSKHQIHILARPIRTNKDPKLTYYHRCPLPQRPLSGYPCSTLNWRTSTRI